ncbi:hypothetical protein FA95DRAFT_1555420 [Auriscalpium vulgare]|uniref:Uncharacterized protein n=1 Tax=Auriscalpium vulgare TaxID=40419 RepID=A0ACB8S2Y5_9AGAM|nr:hypothetical protein FA95DRAFT_1555420 [Auriscalpium vulgare]
MATPSIQQAADGAQLLNPNPDPDPARNHIGRMPAEIMNEIICYALAGPLEADHDDRIRSILLVSRLWRDITQGSREFRSHLPVPRPGANREETEEWLRRTHPYPIRIHAPAYVERDTLESDDYAHHPILGPLEVALRIDNLLRVREIQIEGGRKDDEDHLRPIPISVVLNHLVDLGDDVSLPLEVLRIRSDEYGARTDDFPEDVKFPDNHVWPIFPSLRLVDVKGGEVYPDLSLFASPVLNTVLLEGVGGLWSAWEDLQFGLEALSDAVEVLTLDAFILPDDDEVEGFAEVLPNLQYLRVEDAPNLVVELLRSVAFPYTADLHFAFILNRADLLKYKTYTLSADYWEGDVPFQELIIESSNPNAISWIAEPPSGSAQDGTLQLDVQCRHDDGGFFPEHHEFLLTFSAQLLVAVRKLVIRTRHFPSRALLQGILVHAPQVQEMVITSAEAVEGWIEAMSGPAGIPLVPRLVIEHTTFHGTAPFLHFAKSLRRSGSHGCQTVSFVGCTFEGMTREAWETALKMIGCEVFCTPPGCH